MPITVNCQCGHQFRVRDEYAGKKAQCPNCGDPVVIPSASARHEPVSLGESPGEFPEIQAASTFPSARGSRSGGGRWFAGLDSGLFGLGRLSGLAFLLIGLVFVLMARGCDSVQTRSVNATDARYRSALQEDLGKDPSATKREAHQERVEDLKKESNDARLSLVTWGVWRELLFVAGTVILSIGLLTVGFTGESHERWICLIMIAIITFSIYVGGVAWIHSLIPTASMIR